MVPGIFREDQFMHLRRHSVWVVGAIYMVCVMVVSNPNGLAANEAADSLGTRPAELSEIEFERSVAQLDQLLGAVDSELDRHELRTKAAGWGAMSSPRAIQLILAACCVLIWLIGVEGTRSLRIMRARTIESQDPLRESEVEAPHIAESDLDGKVGHFIDVILKLGGKLDPGMDPHLPVAESPEKQATKRVRNRRKDLATEDTKLDL